MIVYIAVPRSVGVIDTEASQLKEREVQAEAEKFEALAELQTLIDAGYSAVSLEDRHTERGSYRVYGMERTRDRTDLDPSSQPQPDATAHAATV